jgi:hypothetical protein
MKPARSARVDRRVLKQRSPQALIEAELLAAGVEFPDEPAQERLPPAIPVMGGGAGDRGPQPHRRRITISGQVLDLPANQGALDGGQLAGAVDPAAAAGHSRVDPVPTGRDRGAVAGGVGDCALGRTGSG